MIFHPAAELEKIIKWYSKNLGKMKKILQFFLLLLKNGRSWNQKMFIVYTVRMQWLLKSEKKVN